MEIRKLKFWENLSYILLGLIVSPIIYIFFNSFKKNSELTDHIIEFLLKEYIINTLLILIPVMIFTLCIGVGLSYFETFYEYKFRKFFKYTNILSFAIPSYLFAYIYVDFLTGPVYLFLKNFGINWYIDIANIKGAIFILTISLFPYVYISTRSAMKKISMDLIHTSKLLGKNSFKTFLHLILPLTKPAIISSSLLVMMETLNAFGVPFFFGIRVFSTGIYDAWINYYDLDGAMKLSSILLSFVLFILFMEHLLKSKIKYETLKISPIKRIKLKGIKEVFVILFHLIIFIFSLLLPLLYLIRWLFLAINHIYYKDILQYTKLTFYVLFISSFIIIILALFLTNITRLKNTKRKILFNKIATLGYSVPGSVIAVGFLSIFISIDLFLIEKGYIESMWLIKSPIIILFAYTTRFLSVAYLPIENSIEKTGNVLHNSSRILGYSHLKTFFKVDIFMLKGAILSSFLLVSIEIIKEMPLAAMLLSSNTLAVQMKHYASDEELSLIALPAIILIFFTFIFINLYNYIDMKGEDNGIL